MEVLLFWPRRKTIYIRPQGCLYIFLKPWEVSWTFLRAAFSNKHLSFIKTDNLSREFACIGQLFSKILFCAPHPRKSLLQVSGLHNSSLALLVGASFVKQIRPLAFFVSEARKTSRIFSRLSSCRQHFLDNSCMTYKRQILIGSSKNGA